MIQPGRHVLEVGNQDVPGAVDSEEVVHVDIAAVGLRHAFRHQRDRRDAAGAGAHRHAGAFASEPGLDRERRRAEARRRSERHSLADAVELQRHVARADRDRRGIAG